MSRKRICVIAYDVSCHRRRRQVHRTLKEWRIEGQKSVAECRLTETEAEALFLQLGELIDETTDRLLLSWLDKDGGSIFVGTARNADSPVNRQAIYLH